MLETFGWDTVNDSEDGGMDYWFQNENQPPLLFWQAARGDNNYDGQINFADMMIFISWWLESETSTDPGTRLQSDSNFDGIVNLEDMSIIIKQMDMGAVG